MECLCNIEGRVWWNVQKQLGGQDVFENMTPIHLGYLCP